MQLHTSPLVSFDFCVLVVAFAYLELVGYFVLWPIIRVAGPLRVPRQFSVAELIPLLVYQQLVFGFCAAFGEPISMAGWWSALVVMGAAATAAWCGGVEFLNRAGIASSLRRFLFLLGFLPAALITMLGPFLVVIATVIADPRHRWPSAGSIAAAGIFTMVVLPIGLRQVANWFVRSGVAVGRNPG
jgi:hypothetical protein